MKSTLLLLFVASLISLNCNAASKKKEVVTDEVVMNKLTNEEVSQGWFLLFNGRTNDGWRAYNKTFFPPAWIIENGTLKCPESGRGEAGAINGGDIMYAKQKFSDFHLKLEWKVSPGGNSGIFYLGREVVRWEFYRTAPEMQILDNDRHPDALKGKDGNRKAGSLYDLIPAKPQNAKPAGEWNSIEIICNQGTVTHIQNGEKVLEYHLWTPEWNELVKNSKFPSLNPDWANVAKEGIIGLQDHGHAVWFRNIKIRHL